jgi:hypothetical protein
MAYVARALFALGLMACADSQLAPASVSSAWVTESLEKEPDFVMSVDVPGLRRDPFLHKLVDVAMQDVPLPFDPLLSASQVDVFATIRKTFTAVVYGAGSSTPELEACVSNIADRDHVTMATRDGAWIVSNKPTSASPQAVKMDSGALVETWLGPGALDEGLSRVSTDARDLWRHLYAVRTRIEGGSTPALIIDARFETGVDAEHAEYDVGRLRRAMERAAAGVRDEELAHLILGEISNVHVARSGVNVTVAYRPSAAFIQYISQRLDREASGHRPQHC